MSSSSVSARSFNLAACYLRCQDYWATSKPRISTLVAITVAVGGFVAAWGQPEPQLLLHAVVGTWVLGWSAFIWNQWIERDTDAMMPRTADRPVAAGRMDRSEVYVLGLLTFCLGLLELWWAVNRLAALFGLMTWVSYVLVYTPLKRVTRWNTFVGAIPGALPLLIGWAATGQSLDLRAVAMFFIVFFWQFPHFMAIAWKYRHQYAAAGLKMVTVLDPTGRRAGIQAVVGALALLPVSLVPALAAPPTIVYALVCFVLGLGLLGFAIGFWRQRSDASARLLFRASLVYLPLIMLGLASLPFI